MGASPLPRGDAGEYVKTRYHPRGGSFRPLSAARPTISCAYEAILRLEPALSSGDMAHSSNPQNREPQIELAKN
jgi:hypothetical protein